MKFVRSLIIEYSFHTPIKVFVILQLALFAVKENYIKKWENRSDDQVKYG